MSKLKTKTHYGYKTKKKLFDLTKTINNSKKKIDKYQKKLKTLKDSKEEQKLNLKIEIEE